MIEKRIFKTIKDVVLKEEFELREIDKGIFFAPELAIAYQIGKAIYKERAQIFELPDHRIRRREFNLNNGGPSDIVFEIEYEPGRQRFCVIELKLRDRIESYQRDINKLKLLDTNQTRLFCALIDTFDRENDFRIKKLEAENLGVLRRVENLEIFKTAQDWYKRDVECVLGLWTIS